MVTTNNMKNIAIGGIIVAIGIGIFSFVKIMPDENGGEVFSVEFCDDFSDAKILEEASTMNESIDADWWLNSGAYFVQKDGIGRTLCGSLGDGDKWRKKYAEAKPKSTQDGYQPHNIFRLITRSQWKNMSEEVYFRITDVHKTDVDQRGQSNGVLLFGRYKDQDNLYYAGLRVDGQAVIKKKESGIYETLAITPVYEGVYDKEKNVSLLPQDRWIGLRMVIRDDGEAVFVQLFVDKNKNGGWEQILDVVDPGEDRPIIHNGHAGIRTDFMDVEFDDYKIEELIDK